MKHIRGCMGRRWFGAALLALAMCALALTLGAAYAQEQAPPTPETTQAAQILSPEKRLSAGQGYTCWLRLDGSAECWGGNNSEGRSDYHTGPFQQISAGGMRTCAVRVNNSLTCWGDYNDFGSGENVDLELGGPFVTVDTSAGLNCALRPDGSGYCWQIHNGEVLDGEVDGGPFIQISTGGGWWDFPNTPATTFGCGLKADGRSTCWGNNRFGQAEDLPGPFTQIGTGMYHTCGLRPNGSADCWGANEAYVDKGQAADQPGPFSQIALGDNHSCGLKRDGSVDCWGDNAYGKAQDQLGPFTQITAGENQTCGRRPDGSVDCWGAHGDFFGNFEATDQPIPFVVPTEALSANNAHTCGLHLDGSINCWGAGGSLYNYGQAADQPGPFGQVTTGAWHTCALRADGSAYCWGKADAGQLESPIGPFVQLVGGETHTCGLRPTGSVDCWGILNNAPATDQDGPFVRLSSGTYHMCGLKPDGKVDCWGAINFGQGVDQDGPFLQISAGGSHTCGLKPDGGVFCWGRKASGESASQVGPFAMIDAGTRHTCGLRADGSVFCWGDSTKGQAAPQTGPFIQISAGFEHTCGLKGDGAVSCWGRNIEGQSAAPTERFGLLAAPASRVLSAGFRHTCALRPNGRVECWGDSTYGQAQSQDGPYTQVSAGGYHTCALEPDGDAACWGNNEFGQAVHQTGPFTAIAAGGAHTCALKTDGSAHCWGTNMFSGPSDHAGPFVELSSGGSTSLEEEWLHSCGLRADGSVECWGGDMFSWPYAHDTPFRHIDATGFQTCGLGLDGSITCWQAWTYSAGDLPSTHRTGPFSQVSGGYLHACGLKATGGVECWGEDDKGQTAAPSEVFTAVSAGGNHSCALRANGSVECWGDNDYGQSADKTGPFGPYVPADYTPPVAVNDAYTVDQRQQLTVAAPGVLNNDQHQADYPLTAWLVTDVAHGNLILDGSGGFTYLSDTAFNGTDTFTYKVNDGQADSNVATVTIIVQAVYDPPTTIGEKLYALPSANDETYVIDAGPTLDQYRYNADGPVEFAFYIGRVVGRTDPNGYLKDVDWLIAKGIVPAKVTLSVLAFDVDTTYTGTDVKPERNKVYVNGHYVGDLTGGNNSWKQTHFQVDVRHIRFAVPRCNEGSPTEKPVNISECTSPPIASHNTVHIDIDADNSRKAWAIGVDSAALWFDAARPILLVHGRGGSKPGDDACSVPDAGDGCTYWDENDGEYYFGFRGLLNEAGFLTLHMENFMGQDAPATHAKIIKRVVQQMRVRYGVDRINIVSHSKGGLDSRAYVSDFTLNADNDVEVLFTIATPHFGSYLAELSWAVSWFNKHGEYKYTDAMDSLRESNASEFTSTHPARSGVRYYVAYAESGRWCLRMRWKWFVLKPTLVRCAEFEQMLALPERGQRVMASVVYDLLLNNGRLPGGNDFMVTEDSAYLLWAPGHTSANTSMAGPKDLNHHSIAAALNRHNRRDMSIINFISNNLRANAATAASSASLVAPQVAQAAPQAGASSLGMRNGEIAEGQVHVQPVGIDAVTSASFLLSWQVGDLYWSLVDPNGRVITASTNDPKITYEEFRVEGQTYAELLPGKYAVFTIVEPPYGDWQAKITAAGQLPNDRADWVITVIQDSAITLSLTPDAAWKPLNGTVQLKAIVMDEETPAVGAMMKCTIVRPDETTQTVALLDDGAHGDGAADDGVYANSFVGSQYGVHRLIVEANGASHDIPFVRTAFGQVQFGSGTASISGTFGDRGVDSDGDGLYDTLAVDVPVNVTVAGEYAAYAELRSATGGVLAYANATAQLAPGQRKLTLDFDGQEIWAHGGNGRFTLADLQLNDMSIDGVPLQIDYKAAPYTTNSYARDAFQHGAIALTGVTRDYGVDTNGNGKYDELVVELEVALATSGVYSWNGKLVDGTGHELDTDSGEVTLSAGLQTVTFRFDGRAIGASRRQGPYYVVGFALWGEGGFLDSPSVAATAFYNYALFEAESAKTDLFLPLISR